MERAFIIQILVHGIKSKKKLDPKKQLCAGYKSKELKKAYYEYTNNEDPKKIKFKAVLTTRIPEYTFNLMSRRSHSCYIEGKTLDKGVGS